MISNCIKFLAIYLMTMMPISSGWALGNDSNEPLVIDADETELDFKTGKRTWIGNVLVQQGSMTIKADRLDADYKNNVLQKAIAHGTKSVPAIFTQIPEGAEEKIIGKGKVIVLDEIANLITLTDNASLTQGQNVITGCIIKYDIVRETLRAKSGAGCGGVTTTKVLQNPETIPAGSEKKETEKPVTE